MEKEDHEEKVESVFEVLDDERVNGATNKKDGEKELTMEQILEMKEKVLPWRKQMTVRAFAAISLLSIMFAFVVMKLNLTTRIIPSLNVAAGLLGFFFVKTFTKLLEKSGLLRQPFTRQENTVILTCVVAASALPIVVRSSISL